jgi:DNA-directed RNA polymerase specialized sigma24 family protein
MIGARYGVPPQDCEDVVQSAVVDFLLQSQRYKAADPGLLVVIARRRCMDYWRSRQLHAARFISLELIPENDPRVVRGDEYAQGLLDGIGLALSWLKITPRCRQLLSERFFRHTAACDLAVSLGETPGAVKRFMSRCLEKLRILLGARA